MTPAEVVAHIRHTALHHPNPDLRRAADQWLEDHREATQRGLPQPPIPYALTPRGDRAA